MSRALLDDAVAQRQLESIIFEEIRGALVSSDAGWSSAWIERVSQEIADDILRNFEVTAKRHSTGPGAGHAL